MHDGHWNAGVFTINEDRWPPPQGSKKAQKRREDEQTEKHEKKLKTLSSSSEKSRAKLSCLSDRSGSSYILDCFSTVISGLAPSTLLPPYHAYTPHTPTPFHSHTLSHSSSSPLEVDENGPQLLLESEPCLKSAAEEGRGGGEMKWIDATSKREKRTLARIYLCFLEICMYYYLFIHLSAK